MSLKKLLGYLLSLLLLAIPASKCYGDETTGSLVIHQDKAKYTINKNIYGHFSEHLGRCIYDGFWVGKDSPISNIRGIRKDVVEALKRIDIPVLRWPGGCFADDYHWRDGIGNTEERPKRVNVYWGQVVEDNSFGTHEFMDLCQLLDCEPYIAGNVGSSTPQEMANWVEYLTFDGNGTLANLRQKNGRKKPWKVKYWGVGNENWGCGGQMRPEYYADVYRRFAAFLPEFGDNRLYKIACGSHREYYGWTEVLMREVKPPGGYYTRSLIWGLSLHYYVTLGEWVDKGSATEFDEQEWFDMLKCCLRMEDVIEKHIDIMDKYDPEKKVALIMDEWGTWHKAQPGTNPRFLYQQNTLRDAVVAGTALNIFNRHCDRIKMANIAQTINVLQAMILTKGKEMILTPTYHVFKMYNVHHDATLLPLDIECRDYEYNGKYIPAFNASCSKDKNGVIHISLVCLDPRNGVDLSIKIPGMEISEKTLQGEVLTADKMNAHNTFENPDEVHPAEFKGGRIEDGKLLVKLPSKSVLMLELK